MVSSPLSSASDASRVRFDAAAARPPVVVVGTGPVGIRIAQELLRRDPGCPIVIYGDEPWEPYDRVRLSALLAGEARIEDLDNGLRVTRLARIHQHHNCPVVAIDRAARCVVDARGWRQPFHKLVLAVGSRPYVPRVPGVDLPGVFRFRDLSDVERLLSRSAARSRRLVVLGGGLLGLEAARALQRGHTDVTVVHRGPWLMNRQLDEAAAEILRAHVASLGIRVKLNDSIAEVLGWDSVNGVRLTGRGLIPCDTLVIAAGILPNLDLARDAGLAVAQGIRVDDHLRTSDPDIYAVGECAEHRGRVHGIVAPGFEQAAVAADHLLGGGARYEGSLGATTLKVVGKAVFSCGRVGAEEDRLLDRGQAWRDDSKGLYRKVNSRHGRLVGAVAIGPWDELSRVREAVSTGRRLWPWQGLRLSRRGRLWPEGGGQTVAQWPAAAVVCNCTGVTRGTLSAHLAQGAASVDALRVRTGASGVCGSCRPLLEELLGAPAASAAPPPAGRGLLTLSLLASLLALAFLLLPPLPFADTVQGWSWDRLWLDGLYKQVSGFTLLGLTAIGLLLSARKRLKRFGWGGFGSWRLLHVGLGLTTLAILVAHTGLHLGENLNRLLMLNFLLLGLIGAVAGAVTALEARLPSRRGLRLRRFWGWAHILVGWPLLPLLTFHVLAVYYF